VSQVRRVAIALGVSAAIVILVAAMVPRAFIVNDDPGLVVTIRLGAYTPWMSPVLNRLLVWLYESSPEVPWYGLYCYAVIIATGAVLIHTCLELIDGRGGVGRTATWLGAGMLAASHIILAVGITWTTVALGALGTSLVAFVAHLLTCQARQERPSWRRAVIYGVLFVAGFSLREAAVLAMGAALLPLLGWTAIHFARTRYLPRPAAVLAFLAPFVLIVAIQNRIPQSPGAESKYEAFNQQRGRINDVAAFASLDSRAPQLLERAGWSLDDYYDFMSWRIGDETQFTTEKVRRLADTGGVPIPMKFGDAVAVLRAIAVHSAASLWLLFSIAAGGCLLAALGVIDRTRALWFCIINLTILMTVPVVMEATSRFPQRVSLQFFTIAAFGMFAVLANEISRRPMRPTVGRRGLAALAAFSLFVSVWSQDLYAFTRREPFRYHTPLREFAERVTARKGLVMGGLGVAEMDPLLADPRGYDALPSGWGTFSYPWFAYLQRFGIHSGSELLHRMIDNPDAYVIAGPYGHDVFEGWLQRRLGNPAIRLALVDSAWGMPPYLRSELYRLVTTPLERGSVEWQLLVRNHMLDMEQRGSPDLRRRKFRSVELAPPYEQHLSAVQRAARPISISAVDGGLRIVVAGVDETPCTTNGLGADLVGVHIPVNGLGAARIDFALIDAENVVGTYVYAMADDNRSIRWRWELDPEAQRFGYTGTLNLAPGYHAGPLDLDEKTAEGRKIRSLDLIVAVKPGASAGFEVRHIQVSEP
jgi:hypothetical protein